MSEGSKRIWSRVGVGLTAVTLLVALGGALWKGGSLVGEIQRSDTANEQRIEDLEDQRTRFREMLRQQIKNTERIAQLETEVEELRANMDSRFTRLFDHLGIPPDRIGNPTPPFMQPGQPAEDINHEQP